MNDNSHDGLDRRLDAWAAAREPAPHELEQRIAQTLASSLAPVRPLASPTRLAVVFLAIFAVCAAALTAAIGTTGIRLTSAAQLTAISAILGIAAVLFSLALANQMIPASLRVLPFSALLALASAAVIAAIALLFPWTTPRLFLEEGWPCSAMETAIALPAALLFFLLARRGALFPGSTTGATIASLAVLLALAVLQFQCMFQQAPHLLVWHLGVAAILIAAGALLGKWSQHRAS